MLQENVEIARRGGDAFGKHGVEAGEDVVIVVTRVRGRGKDSGVPIEAPALFVQEFRDGQVVRDRVFLSKAEALEAAGLRE